MNAIIFDFDGTIADSFDQVLAFLLKAAGRSTGDVSAEQIAAWHHLSMRDLALAVGIPHWRLPFVYFQGKAVLTKHMQHTPFCQGMDTVLKELHAEGYRLFIVSSNSRRNIRRFLVEHGLSGYFARIYGNAGWFGKASILRRVVEINKLSKTGTVYVGDEARDIFAAHRAGIGSIGVTWGFSSERALLAQQPTMVVHSTHELSRILVGLGRE